MTGTGFTTWDMQTESERLEKENSELGVKIRGLVKDIKSLRDIIES